jgi:hypothetical protein
VCLLYSTTKDVGFFSYALINAFVFKILFQAQLLSYVLDMVFMPPKACAPPPPTTLCHSNHEIQITQ